MSNAVIKHYAVYRSLMPGLQVFIMIGLILSPKVNADNEFLQWKAQQAQSYQEYKDKRDREFAEFLKMHWTEIQLLKGVERDSQPKPVVMPVAKIEPVAPADKPADDIPTQPETPVVIIPLTVPVPVDVLPQQPEPAYEKKGRRINLKFYGTPLTLYYDGKLKTPLANRIDNDAVSGFWSALSRADYDGLIKQLEAQRTALQLNDWAYLLLVNDITKQIYPGSENQQTLLTWFVLAKSGYKARIAYDSHGVYLLMPSNQPLYSTPYFTYEKLRYYAVQLDGSDQTLGNVYTYAGQYPGTNKHLDMALKRDMVIIDRPAKRKLSFTFEGRHYDIDVSYDAKRVDFLGTYPQLDLGVYFGSNVSSTTAASLLLQLSEDMQGMGEQQAVNFLLSFVQSSLKYKTDELQFGKENYLFPEETLYYPYSDCEDRSILFAWLVKSLLGLEVVGLVYPGHVATAVHLVDNVKGDAISHNGKNFVVADPTFVNAVVGMTMPDYINRNPEIIELQ